MRKLQSSIAMPEAKMWAGLGRSCEHNPVCPQFITLAKKAAANCRHRDRNLGIRIKLN